MAESWLVANALRSSCGEFGGRGDGLNTAAGEHVLEQAQNLICDQTVGGQNLLAIEPKGRAVEAEHGSTCLHHQQRARGRIPGVQIEFPKAVYPAGCSICQIESRRACPANTMGAQRQLLIEVDVGVQVALVTGKTGGEQTLLQEPGARDMQTAGSALKASVARLLAPFRQRRVRRELDRKPRRPRFPRPDPVPVLAGDAPGPAKH